MPLDANCPKCKNVFPITEARSAVGVQCPGCDAELTAEFRKRPTTEPGQHPYELFISPGRPIGSPPPLDKKKPRETDEEEEVQGGGGMGIVVVAGLGALILAIAGLGGTGYWLFTNLDTSDATLNNLSHSDNNGGPRPGNRPPPPFGDSGSFNPGKQKDNFQLRPVAAATPPISPPSSLDAAMPQPILLPGRARASAVGGGGRYIIFHFPEQGRLAVFDANVGDLTTSEGMENGDVQMAAGANKLVVSVPGTRKYRVYSIPDLKRENEFEPPLFHGGRLIAMGSRTNGPLLCVDPFGHVVLMGIASGKPIDGSDQELRLPSDQLRASSDGKLFVASNGYGRNEKFSIVDEFGRKWRVRSPDITDAYPSADGNHLLGKEQIITTSLRPVADRGNATAGCWYVPALTATGEYFLKVDEVTLKAPPRERKGVSIALHKGFRNVNQPVLSPWIGLPECEGFVDAFGGPLVYDQHLFLIPEAKLLVILNNEKTKIVVHKLQI